MCMNVSSMKIALGFWGLTRSLKHTIQSIEQHIINVLKNANIEYKIFIHTYSFNSQFNNERTGETGIQLDFEEYKLLNPDFFKVDDQDYVKQQINLNQYRRRRDPWNSGYQCVDNFLCSMYSKRELGKLIQQSNFEFDYVLFLRPDVLYLNDFDLSILHSINDTTIGIPNFALWGHNKFNDRMCITNYKNAFIYSSLFDHMLKFSRKNALHSETYQSAALREWFQLNIHYFNFFFNRIRANGIEQIDCPHDDSFVHRTRFFDHKGRFINHYVYFRK